MSAAGAAGVAGRVGVADAPYYEAQGEECELFAHAFRRRLPLLLKGPTGCGKTRFVLHMAARLGRPCYTVACHDDLTAADLTGRYLLKGGETVWVDGPLTRAVREGAICYLDEVVEARKDVTVVLHPLTDDRRLLPLERTGEQLRAADGFMLVVSYNP
ncbi:MAG TPA: AAA family ATPase, partial [Pelomicrobium sp.]|nr:AAA family ATPase [Pelomicrobium sp.]